MHSPKNPSQKWKEAFYQIWLVVHSLDKMLESLPQSVSVSAFPSTIMIFLLLQVNSSSLTTELSLSDSSTDSSTNLSPTSIQKFHMSDGSLPNCDGSTCTVSHTLENARSDDCTFKFICLSLTGKVRRLL